MKLCISNIAWPQQDEALAAKVMVEHGLSHVEVAPTKEWPAPLEASDQQVDAYRRFWNDRGIEIAAMQALLYGRGDLVLFESPERRRELLDYLRGIFRIGARLGAGPLVFGSPKNRKRGGMPDEEAYAIGVEFFRSAGTAASEEGVTLCIEANPTQYQCDWITTSEQASRLVRDVDTPGFGLHLDAAGMKLAGDDGAFVIQGHADAIQHFHISEANLGAIGEGETPHAVLAAALRSADYQHVASVEMRHDPSRETAGELRRVLRFLVENYGASNGQGGGA